MALEARGLSIAFDRTVVQSVSIQVNPGAKVSIVGPSGSGKSSLLRALAGIDRAKDGQVLLDATTLHAPTRAVGLVFQSNTLFPWLTALENVAFGQVAGSSRRATPVEMLRRVGMELAAQLYPFQLSTGMAQRVALARALMADPKFLLLDEPFSAIDGMARPALQQLLLSVCADRNIGFVLVTHDLLEAVQLTDRAMVLAGSPATFVAEYAVQAPAPRDLEGLPTPAALEDATRLAEICRRQPSMSV